MNLGILSTSDPEESCLQELKLLIQKHRKLDHFSEFFEDRFLLHFVRGRKYDVEKAYTTLENYINVRRIKYRDLFKSLRPSTNKALDIGGIRILRNRDPLNRLVIVHRDIYWDPKEVPIQERSSMLVLSAEEIWNYKDAEVNGVVLVFDLAGYTLNQAMAVTISEFIKAITLCWNNFPLRPKAVHFINENFVFTLLFKTLKPFLPKKIRERLYFHGSNIDAFHEHLSPTILPDFLGGNLTENEAFDMTFEQRIRDKEGYYQRFAELL